MNEFPMYDESDPEQVARAQDAIAARTMDEIDSARVVLSTYDGRAFVWKMLQFARVDQLSFAGEMPLTTAFNEGAKNVAQQTENLIFTATPEAYSMIRHEALLREQKYAEQVGLGETEEE